MAVRRTGQETNWPGGKLAIYQPLNHLPFNNVFTVSDTKWYLYSVYLFLSSIPALPTRKKQVSTLAETIELPSLKQNGLTSRQSTKSFGEVVAHTHSTQTTMVIFNGTAKIRVIEAKELRPTEWSKRFNTAIPVTDDGGNQLPLDAYVNVDCDEYHVGQTATRPKTTTPVWNEDYQTEVHNGKVLGFSIFHDCALPPDDFVANCRITFDDLKLEGAKNDIWVDLEPHGKLHLLIELQGTAMEGGLYLD
uniref:C2 domain-containing protein n=1 Tax=Ditylenchus dipsaci TaxID=166011 RepID=A0A915EJI2_9BILA